jgi:hypothetical protein
MRPFILLPLLAITLSTPAQLNSPFNDSTFFPLCVWVQQPRNADKYKDLGINTYVALYRGPTEEQLDALDKAGLHAICSQNQAALKFKDRKTIIAWMHGDEPDNAQPRRDGGKGYGPPITPEKIIENYNRIKSNDPTRPVLLNLGQGVAWDRWYGRGVRSNHPEDYPQYLKGSDIASFDIYPVTHDKPEIAGQLHYVAHGVSRLRTWTESKKPVWACIETTHIHNENALPTPGQIRSEIWLAITHGATGIIYFCHEFKPKSIEAGLLAHPENAQAVKEINARIRQLAPVLNSPTLSDVVKVEPRNKDAPIAVLAKRHEGALYLFAANTRNTPTPVNFALSTAAQKIEVLDENRSLTAADGKFQDTFEGYAVHLYRLTGSGAANQ